MVRGAIQTKTAPSLTDAPEGGRGPGRHGVMGAVRARMPWALWAFSMLTLAGTLTLAIVNGSVSEDAAFIPLAFAMVLGYCTVGALIASRDPGNAIGWLMIGIGFFFILSGLSDEYITYAYGTNPGSLPLAPIAAWLSSELWLLMITALILLVLLFPTGHVPGPRWNYLPLAIIALSLLSLVASFLIPGPLSNTPPGVRVENPMGVQELKTLATAATVIGVVGVFLTAFPSLAALVLRYRRSRGDERQQIRWLAYVAGTTVALIVVALITGLIVGESFGDSPLNAAFFFAIFTLAGLGVPSALGVATLKYRLYDLDLVLKKTVLYATVAIVLTVLFLVIAIAIGGFAGKSEAGAVVAAAAIGLSFWPVLRLARLLADRIVYGGRATPYEILADFSARVVGSYAPEEVVPRMAQILRDAVGASRAIVWLRVGQELRPAAVSPPDPGPASIGLLGDRLPPLPADVAVEVRDGGDLLGALTVSMPANDPMNPSKERLVHDLASQAGLVLRNVRLIEELRESRRRIVAAQDERARKLERNIHDGAQQQLVALSVKLRLAEQLAAKDAAKTKTMLAQLQEEVTEALETLRDLARGVYPPLLADQGLAAAVRAQAGKSPVPVGVETDGIRRYPQEIEAAVYFCILEALQNIAKYAEAGGATVRLGEANGDLTFVVEDDGVGFEPATATGSGLRNMRDRLEALRGDLQIISAHGAGTSITGRVPAPALESMTS